MLFIIQKYTETYVLKYQCQSNKPWWIRAWFNFGMTFKLQLRQLRSLLHRYASKGVRRFLQTTKGWQKDTLTSSALTVNPNKWRSHQTFEAEMATPLLEKKWTKQKQSNLFEKSKHQRLSWRYCGPIQNRVVFLKYCFYHC